MEDLKRKMGRRRRRKSKEYNAYDCLCWEINREVGKERKLN